MKKVGIDLAQVLQAGFELYKRNFGILLLVNLIAMVISSLTIGILAGPMAAGIVMVTLRLLDGREPKPGVGDVFKGFEVFLASFIYMIIILAITTLASFILPGLSMVVSYVLATLTVFTIFFIAEDRMDFWPAIVRSYEIVKDNFFAFFLVVLVAGLISSAGLILCCIGIIFTAPYYYCVLAVVYRKHFPVGSIDAADTVEIKVTEVMAEEESPPMEADDESSESEEEKPAE